MLNHCNQSQLSIICLSNFANNCDCVWWWWWWWAFELLGCRRLLLLGQNIYVLESVVSLSPLCGLYQLGSTIVEVESTPIQSQVITLLNTFVKIYCISCVRALQRCANRHDASSSCHVHGPPPTWCDDLDM